MRLNRALNSTGQAFHCFGEHQDAQRIRFRGVSCCISEMLESQKHDAIRRIEPNQDQGIRARSIAPLVLRFASRGNYE